MKFQRYFPKTLVRQQNVLFLSAFVFTNVRHKIKQVNSSSVVLACLHHSLHHNLLFKHFVFWGDSKRHTERLAADAELALILSANKSVSSTIQAIAILWLKFQIFLWLLTKKSYDSRPKDTVMSVFNDLALKTSFTTHGLLILEYKAVYRSRSQG